MLMIRVMPAAFARSMICGRSAAKSGKSRWAWVSKNSGITIWRAHCEPAAQIHSSPGYFPFRLFENDALQEADAFLQPFARRHQAVLVFHRTHPIVAGHAECGDEVA